MPIGDGSIARAIGKGLKERFPIGGAILETLGPEVIQAIQGPNQIVDIGALAEKLEKVAKKEPEVVNNLNLESPLQSGTTWGNGVTLAALGSALGVAVWQYWTTGSITQEAFLALFSLGFVGIGGTVYALYRRWAPNLKPLGK